jgi:very-short-patch-repair endonuclease
MPATRTVPKPATRAVATAADGTICQATADKSARRRGWDRRIAEVAGEQQGLVALWQLEGLGIERRTVQARVLSGRLHRVHQGVFTVGHTVLSEQGRFLAAVLACGPGAVLSHRSAAALWGICPEHGGPIDVTAPNRRGRAPKGIRAHRDGALAAGERTVFRGVPCTTPARILLDLAGTIPTVELKRALAEAEVRRLIRHDAVRALIRRHRGRRGVARLRLLLDEVHPATKRTRSELERMFLDICARAKLPQPEVNVKLEVEHKRLEVDFLWRDAALIMEADSREFHDTDSAFLNDRRREQELQLAGWRVSHCTWAQLEHEPRHLAHTIRRLIAQA